MQSSGITSFVARRPSTLHIPPNFNKNLYHDNQDASLSPDGETVIFVSNQTGNYEIFEMNLSGKQSRLTNLNSILGLPAISPDNKWIAFTNRVDNFDQIWLMNRDGSDARMIFSLPGIAAVAPTWFPDSDEILFAVGKDLARQLYIMGTDGEEPPLLSDQISLPDERTGQLKD